jgi:hypothetical protein
MDLDLNIHYMFGYVSAGNVMKALTLEMSGMQNVYRARHLKMDLGIALRPHRQLLDKELLIV